MHRRAYKRRLKAQHMHVLLEHFLHIDLGWLRIQRQDGAKRVFWRTVAVVGWQGLVCHVGSSFSEFDWLLLHAHVGLIPALGKFVTVVNEAFTAVDLDFGTAHQVGWPIVYLILEAHAWAVSKDGFLSQPLLFKQHGEGILSRVLSVDFLDFNLSIGEVVVQNIVFVAAIVRPVLP